MSQHEICRRLMCLTCEWGALEFRLSVETFVKQTLKIHSRVKLCTDLCPLFPQEENSSTEVGTLNNQLIFCLTTEYACFFDKLHCSHIPAALVCKKSAANQTRVQSKLDTHWKHLMLYDTKNTKQVKLKPNFMKEKGRMSFSNCSNWCPHNNVNK